MAALKSKAYAAVEKSRGSYAPGVQGGPGVLQDLFLPEVPLVPRRQKRKITLEVRSSSTQKTFLYTTLIS